ncbi:MAG TPA: lipopolysaccharide heptosyltransferase II [Pirellulales bacterium]|jgi:heptosyltransferase-2|nr:lipopolysaccharide heptosyltransferase II [Pirellulales bacterium]
MKIGIFLPNWVGDAAMATPTLRALRKHCPDATLVGVMRPSIADVLAGTSWLDEEIRYDRTSADSAQCTLGVIRQLRRQRLDVALLLTNSWRGALLAYLGRAKRRIGYARSGRECLLTDVLHAPKIGRQFMPSPVLDYYLELAYKLGCPPASPRLELATLLEDERQADLVWKRLGLTSRSVVAFNSSGAFGAAKLWPAEYFAALARRVVQKYDQSVLVLCGPGERVLAREIVRLAGHRRVVSLGEQSVNIGLTKACVRRSQLLVTTDSGPRHFAAAFDVPVVTLFGPTHIQWSENHYDRATHLQLKLACQPCQQRVCPEGHHRCMRDLSIDRVDEAVAAHLKVRPQVRAA